EGTRIALEAAKKNRVRHFTLVSSSAVFGSPSDGDCPIRENSGLLPVEPYGWSKLAGEHIVSREISAGGFSCSIVRPRTVVGKERMGIFQILFEWISQGRNVYTIGRGRGLFQLISIEDLVDALVEITVEKKTGEFNLGTDRFASLLEALTTLCRNAGT